MLQIGRKKKIHSGNRCTFYLLWWFPSVTYSLSNVHIDCLLFFFFFSISARQFMYGILQAWSGLNSLIWARLVYVVSETIVFRRTSQADRQILPRADSLSILRAAACAFTLCYQAGDWFLRPSCLPFPLCFKAQFREAYDVLTRRTVNYPAKRCKRTKHLAETDRFCPSICGGGLLPFRARPHCEAACDVLQRWG